MQTTTWLQKTIRRQDNRSHPRWIDPRTALVSLEGKEHLGKVRDLSPAGASLSVLDAHVDCGQEVSLAISFEHGVVPFNGRVVHAAISSWGSVVGITFDPGQHGSGVFLRNRYGLED